MTPRPPSSLLLDPRRWPRNAWIWIVIAGLLVWLYGIEGNPEQSAEQGRSAVGWMIGRWQWSAADMSHGWLIPLVSLYILWQQRAELAAAPRAVSGRGLIVVAGSLLLYLLGMRVQQTRLVLMSLIGLAWGLPFFLYGPAVARRFLFPAAYLIFCIPFTFLEQLTLPLRLISTSVSAGVLNGLGIPVQRMGTALYFTSGNGLALDVAHPCSGLRYLVAMVALTTAYAYFTQRTWPRRLTLFVTAVPLAMIGNIVRIVLIGLVALTFGTDVALGFYHDYSGYVVFAVAILLMIWMGAQLNRLKHAPAAEVSS